MRRGETGAQGSGRLIRARWPGRLPAGPGHTTRRAGHPAQTHPDACGEPRCRLPGRCCTKGRGGQCNLLGRLPGPPRPRDTPRACAPSGRVSSRLSSVAGSTSQARMSWSKSRLIVVFTQDNTLLCGCALCAGAALPHGARRTAAASSLGTREGEGLPCEGAEAGPQEGPPSPGFEALSNAAREAHTPPRAVVVSGSVLPVGLRVCERERLDGRRFGACVTVHSHGLWSQSSHAMLRRTRTQEGTLHAQPLVELKETPTTRLPPRLPAPAPPPQVVALHVSCSPGSPRR